MRPLPKGGARLDREVFPTKAAYAYTTLRERIVSGYYRPGEVLVITRLKDDLGVSESAVREAVNRLKGERLLEITPHTAVRVTELTLREAEEIFELRIALESMAACKAIGRLRPADREQLEAINAELLQHLLAGDIVAANECNNRFHDLLYRASGSQWLQTVIRQLSDYSQRLRASLLALGSERRDIQVVQHRAILDAIATGDPELVTAAVTQHLQTALAVYQEYLRLFATPPRAR